MSCGCAEPNLYLMEMRRRRRWACAAGSFLYTRVLPPSAVGSFVSPSPWCGASMAVCASSGCGGGRFSDRRREAVLARERVVQGPLVEGAGVLRAEVRREADG